MRKTNLMRALTMLLVAALLCTGGFAVHADDGIMPCLETVEYANLNFKIENGVASVSARYKALYSDFDYAKFTYKIQKKTFGFIWTTVDIGEPNNERTLYCYDQVGDVGLSYSISGTGTYRAVMKLEICATNGYVETINETKEVVYN